jgi:hypothetical protein
MPSITLNLLAEEQQALEARARDPIKIFIAVGLGMLTLAVAGGGALSAMLGQKHAQLQGLQAQWNKMNQVGAEDAEFQRANALAEEIVAYNRSRILIAPQLALVKDLVLPSVQLSRIGFTINVETSGSDSGGGDGANGKRAARPKRVERLVLRMEGTAAGSPAELEVDRFLKSLRADARFNAAVEDIQLRSITGSVTARDKTGGAPAEAGFTIECSYRDRGAK